MAMVGDLNIGALVILGDLNVDIPVVRSGAAVANGIFHNGLEDQRGDLEGGQILRQIPGDVDGVFKAGLGQGQIVVHIGQFLLQGHKLLVNGKGLPEIVGQGQNVLLGPVRVCGTQGGDGV